MITEDLIIYINSQLKKNISRDVIITKLVNSGWHKEDIEEGFIKINPPAINIDKNNHLYKEIEEEIKNDMISTAPSAKTEGVVSDAPKIWTPMSITPKKSNEFKNDRNIINSSTPKSILNENEELLPSLLPKKSDSPQIDTLNNQSLENIIIAPFFNPSTSIVKEEKEEILPENIIPDSKIIHPIILTKKPSHIDLPKAVVFTTSTQNIPVPNNIKIVPKKRMSKYVEIIIIILIITIICGGAVYAVNKGFIKANLSFIKKDPKVLFLNSQNKIINLEYYKVDNEVNISFPSLANITNGLINNESVKSDDRDKIAIKSTGSIDKKNKSNLSESLVTINSSFFKNEIVTDIKSDGLNLYINIPDLSQILNKNVPKVGLVSVPINKVNTYLKEFPEVVTNRTKMFNFSKILNNNISDSSDNIPSLIKDYIHEAEFVEKVEEKIKGINTYHYEINASQQLNKRLLANLTKVFMRGDATGEDLKSMDALFGSIKIDSLEFWVGKNDDIIYQYRLVLSIPLSKIIGFEDKGISGEDVEFDFKRTYYDFNVPNKIEVPTNAMPIIDFINNIHEANLKSEVSSLKSSARLLLSSEGSFGKQSNLSGSCLNPTTGSFFSPVGHSKTSNEAIARISETLNSVLTTTKGMGLCYANSKAWAFAIPLSDNYQSLSDMNQPQSYFCVDSIGSEEVIDSPIKNPKCK